MTQMEDLAPVAPVKVPKAQTNHVPPDFSSAAFLRLGEASAWGTFRVFFFEGTALLGFFKGNQEEDGTADNLCGPSSFFLRGRDTHLAVPPILVVGIGMFTGG